MTQQEMIFESPEEEKMRVGREELLAWRIPGMGEPGGLPSMGLHRVGHDSSDLAAAERGTGTIDKTGAFLS